MTCTRCHGVGIRMVRNNEKEALCNCVYRAAFRACYRRFRDCAVAGELSSNVVLEFCNGQDGRRTYSRKREEYMADFCLVSRRMLDDEEYRLFRFHFLLGADWRLCCRQLKIDRGAFFHGIYRIEQRLGHAFAELKPYALWPLDEYFYGSIRKSAGSGMVSSIYQRAPIRLPLSA